MLQALQDSKFIVGIAMIVMNLYGRYIVDEISTSEEEYRRNLMLRRIAIFAVCFTATRDLIVSFFLTAGFVILAMGVSRRGQEGMANRDKIDPKVEQPAYDVKTPELFQS